MSSVPVQERLLGSGPEAWRLVLWTTLVAHRKYGLPVSSALDAAMRWCHSVQRYGSCLWADPEPDAPPEVRDRVRRLRRRWRYRQEGRCRVCGKPVAGTGGIYCSACAEEYREYMREWRRKRREAAGG